MSTARCFALVHASFANLLCMAGVFVACLAHPSMSQAAVASVAPLAPLGQTAEATAPSARTLVAGRDYLVLAKPMPAPVDRLEVAYFFWYNSPTTAKVDGLIRSWAANEASPFVKFRPLPAVLKSEWGYGARVFFALQQLDKEPQLSPKLIQAIEQGIVDYNKPITLRAWLKDQGISPQRLQKAINSPLVVAQTSWMPALMKPYGVQRVPTVVIDGQFLFVADPQETPQSFVSRIAFASQALSQRKLQIMAKQRAQENKR